MKKFLFVVAVIFFSSFFAFNNTEARSGCCSHHGGVCGCGCCDGSSLSATCAPYYPSCNDANPEPIQPERIISPSVKSNTNLNSVSNDKIQEIKTVDPIVETNNKIQNTEVTREAELQKNNSSALPIANQAYNTVDNPTTNNDDGGAWWTILSFSIIGGIIYLVKKKKK
jgi:LPXTG-motif cell wall-anchored protein